MFEFRVNVSEGLKLDTSKLTDYELVIAAHLVVPQDINVNWADIAGLDSVVEELRESVVLPVRHRNLIKNSQLWQAPKGVLLHGPPGIFLKYILLGFVLHIIQYVILYNKM